MWSLNRKMGTGETRFLTVNNGIYYTRKGKFEVALKNFNECVASYSDAQLEVDGNVFFRRGQTSRELVDTESALLDALNAFRLKPRNPAIAMAVIQNLHELNRFEECAALLQNVKTVFRANTRKLFEDALDVIYRNVDATVGEPYTPFVNKRGNTLFDAWRNNKKTRPEVDSRPQWKIRRDNGQCDITSMEEKNDTHISPIETARRARAFMVFTQTYLRKNYADVLLLRDLESHATLKCPHFVISMPELAQLMNKVNKNLKAFMSMLHARDPMYSIEFDRCRNKKQLAMERERRLYFAQYNTRRAMFCALKLIKQYRERKLIHRLEEYVETLMGDYLVVKNYRIVPWKFEFANEVYNHLGLAYITQYHFKGVVGKKEEKTRLRTMFHLPIEEKLAPPVPKFGDKTLYKDEAKARQNFVLYRKYIERLEKRLAFSNLPIERAYLRHQMAKSHFQWKNFEKCDKTAQMGIKEARRCNNRLWELLNYFQCCKAQIILRKLEMLKETLTQAFAVAQGLKDINLCFFVETCLQLTLEILNVRRSHNTYGSHMSKNRSMSTRGSKMYSNVSSSELEFREKEELESVIFKSF